MQILTQQSSLQLQSLKNERASEIAVSNGKLSNKLMAAVSTSGVVNRIKKGTVFVNVSTVDGKRIAKCKVVVTQGKTI